MKGVTDPRLLQEMRPAPLADLRAWVLEKRRQGVPWSHIARQSGRHEAALREAFEGVTG